MLDIAIDVGSGVTKLRSDDTRINFRSLSGKLGEKEFSLAESEGEAIRFARKGYAVADLAERSVAPTDLVNTCDPGWFATDEYLALLYAAMGRVLKPDFSGKIRLCTGLPQALYQANRDALIGRLAKKHLFYIDDTRYRVTLRKEDIIVMPQVMGLFLSRLEKDPSLKTKKVAVIDVGTYTSDWTVIDKLGTVGFQSGGTDVGVAQVIKKIGEYLESDHRTRCSAAGISAAIQSGNIVIAGRTLDLADRLNMVVRECAGPMIECVTEQWDGAMDSEVIVGGGGGPLFGPAIRDRMAHAQVILDDEPIYSIVDGYHTYLKHRRKQKEAA